MKPVLYQLDSIDCSFPDARLALTDPDGLLAVGGDLSSKRLINAYESGIFPWFSEGDPIMWWSPEDRGVLFFNDFYINRSFKKFLKKTAYRLSVNLAFEEVISHCSAVNRPDQAGTWITQEMIDAYIQLHKQGRSHSFEVWQDDTLVGGLYGVNVGNCFCGESMFHLSPYASKFAYLGLVNFMQKLGGTFIDCQMQNEFLETLGVSEISRDLYLNMLASSKQQTLIQDVWHPRFLDID